MPDRSNIFSDEGIVIALRVVLQYPLSVLFFQGDYLNK